MLILKKCTKCGKQKSILDFYIDRKKSRGGKKKNPKKFGRLSWCKECYLVQYRLWKQVNPKRKNDWQKDWRKNNVYHNSYLKSRYGITVKQYNKMLLGQNYVCAICGKQNANLSRLGVDHNHKTGKIRGLLCRKCNAVIGMVDENPQHLLKMIEYLISKNKNDKSDDSENQLQIHSGA